MLDAVKHGNVDIKLPIEHTESFKIPKELVKPKEGIKLEKTE